MERKSEDRAWRIWDRWPEYGELLFRRATGAEAEMESSKATCSVLSKLYAPGMKVLDVGCGSGHYYYSLKKRVDPAIDYCGIDLTEYYVELAGKAHGASERFRVGDVNQLEFEDATFDVVLCINMLVNLPPPPTRAIRELVRVSRRYVVIRTLFGERNYIIKELHEDAGIELDLVTEAGELPFYHYNNIYTESSYRRMLEQAAPGSDVEIARDTDWKPFDNRGLVGPTATTALGDKQVSGNLLFDWRFIVLKKRDARLPEKAE